MFAAMTSQPRPKLGVSRCLMGEAVRYDGKDKRLDWIAGVLARHVDLVPVCPEVEAGMETPREPMHVALGPEGEARVLGNDSGDDYTAPLRAFIAARVPALEAEGLDGFAFKANSPSCGLAVPVTGAEAPGAGLFAAALTAALPRLPVAEDTALAADPAAREHFAIRLFAHARLRALLASDWTPKDLTAFHAREKMLLLAHDRHVYDQLGRIAAEAHTRPREEAAQDYAAGFMAALSRPASVNKHVNALQHMAGHFKGRLDTLGREEMRDAIEDYRTGAAPRRQAVALLRELAAEVGLNWVLEQTYLDPCPDELLA